MGSIAKTSWNHKPWIHKSSSGSNLGLETQLVAALLKCIIVSFHYMGTSERYYGSDIRVGVADWPQ